MGRVVGIAGATGAVGKELVEVLQGAPWGVDAVVPLARAQTTVGSVQFRGESVAVDDLAHAVFDELDVLVVCLPADVGGATVRAARAAGTPVVDLSGSQFEDLSVPVLLPWLPLPPGVAMPGDVVAAPGPVATLIASVVGPLALAGARGAVSATVMVPASFWGRQGVEELSQQVVALFNSGTPARKVFEHGFAFDLVPQVGPAAPSGWAASELRAMTEVARLTGVRTDLALIGVPVFSGISAQLRVPIPRDWDADRVTRVLSEAGVTVAPAGRKTPRPRRSDGEPFAQVGRIRQVPGEDAVLIWASMDNLRTAATAAVGLAGRMLREVDVDA